MASKFYGGVEDNIIKGFVALRDSSPQAGAVENFKNSDSSLLKDINSCTTMAYGIDTTKSIGTVSIAVQLIPSNKVIALFGGYLDPDSGYMCFGDPRVSNYMIATVNIYDVLDCFAPNRINIDTLKYNIEELKLGYIRQPKKYSKIKDFTDILRFLLKDVTIDKAYKDIEGSICKKFIYNEKDNKSSNDPLDEPLNLQDLQYMDYLGGVFFTEIVMVHLSLCKYYNVIFSDLRFYCADFLDKGEGLVIDHDKYNLLYGVGSSKVGRLNKLWSLIDDDEDPKSVTLGRNFLQKYLAREKNTMGSDDYDEWLDNYVEKIVQDKSYKEVDSFIDSYEIERQFSDTYKPSPSEKILLNALDVISVSDDEEVAVYNAFKESSDTRIKALIKKTGAKDIINKGLLSTVVKSRIFTKNIANKGYSFKTTTLDGVNSAEQYTVSQGHIQANTRFFGLMNKVLKLL